MGGYMKKYSMICSLIIQSTMIIAMNIEKERQQVKRMELVRRIFKKRDSTEMILESSMHSDDEMSLERSGSGSFPILIPRVEVQKKSSGYRISEQGSSPSRIESCIDELAVKAEMNALQKKLMNELVEKAELKK